MSICLFVCLFVLFKTYKLYYGGAQKRPDGNYCKTVRSAEGNNIQHSSTNRYIITWLLH